MTPEQVQELAHMLRSAREEQALSIREVGRLSGTSDTTVMRLEQASFVSPQPETVWAIAKALDMNTDDVLTVLGFTPAEGLPSFRPYLRTKYGQMPDAAQRELEAYFVKLAKKHGLSPDQAAGPKPGEDETEEEE